MINNQYICNSDAVERFLADQLDEDERRAFEQHLDACEACRRALRSAAAAEDWWREAQSYLGPGPSLATSSELPAIDVEQPPDKTDAADRNWSLDFLAPTDDPRMLGRFGGYEISGVVGRGGMGIVLKGLDLALNRYVAIKVLAPHLAASGAARRRFAREAQSAAAVVHENVIAIHGVSEERGLPYLVMPYFRGASLQKRLDETGPLATCEALRVGMQVAAGLAAAHAQGLVHRDIKPANILLPSGVERVKITDFGLARACDDASLTHSGVIAGTPQYMSPEQARGDGLDARSDLFSLGSVLYAAVAGRPPFRAQTSYGVLRRICESEPRPIRELSPETPEWLGRVIGKLHAKSPDGRFQSASEVADVLEQCLAHMQNPSLRLPEWLADEPRGRRRWLRWSAAASVAGAVVVGVLAATGMLKLDHSGFSEEGAAAAAPAGEFAASPSAASSDAVETAWEDGTTHAFEQLYQKLSDLDAGSQGLWEPRIEPPTLNKE